MQSLMDVPKLVLLLRGFEGSKRRRLQDDGRRRLKRLHDEWRSTRLKRLHDKWRSRGLKRLKRAKILREKNRTWSLKMKMSLTLLQLCRRLALYQSQVALPFPPA